MVKYPKPIGFVFIVTNEVMMTLTVQTKNLVNRLPNLNGQTLLDAIPVIKLDTLLLTVPLNTNVL